jgi:N-methylhydantoinase A
MGDLFRLGVDIGGTFTDIVLVGSDGSVRAKKVLSTPDDYALAVVDGARDLLEEAGVCGEMIEDVVHASTIASNPILEGRGARTALITRTASGCERASTRSARGSTSAASS